MIRETLATFTTVEKSEAEIQALISARHDAFWVIGAPSVAGFATYGPFRAGPGYAGTVEHTVILADSAQGQGYGRALMTQLEQHARQSGIHVLVAGISSANPNAAAFHKAMGFAQVAHMPQVGRKQSQWLDLILMQKNHFRLLTSPIARGRLRNMSIWTRISEALAALTSGEGLTAVFDRLRSPPERSVAFTIAVIALGAKMAKADGLVTRDEVTAFREVFRIAEGDTAGAAKVFDLARQDVAGFDDYARRIATMFHGHPDMLHDLMEGLFHIAMADGIYHPNENAFLEEVAEIFALPVDEFAALKVRFVPDASPLPHMVLGIASDAPMAEARKAWRKLVQANHPDALVARGLPEEAIKMAEKRLIDINLAWETLSRKHA